MSGSSSSSSGSALQLNPDKINVIQITPSSTTNINIIESQLKEYPANFSRNTRHSYYKDGMFDEESTPLKLKNKYPSELTGSESEYDSSYQDSVHDFYDIVKSQTNASGVLLGVGSVDEKLFPKYIETREGNHRVTIYHDNKYDILNKTLGFNSGSGSKPTIVYDSGGIDFLPTKSVNAVYNISRLTDPSKAVVDTKPEHYFTCYVKNRHFSHYYKLNNSDDVINNYAMSTYMIPVSHLYNKYYNNSSTTILSNNTLYFQLRGVFDIRSGTEINDSEYEKPKILSKASNGDNDYRLGVSYILKMSDGTDFTFDIYTFKRMFEKIKISNVIRYIDQYINTRSYDGVNYIKSIYDNIMSGASPRSYFKNGSNKIVFTLENYTNLSKFAAYLKKLIPDIKKQEISSYEMKSDEFVKYMDKLDGPSYKQISELLLMVAYKYLSTSPPVTINHKTIGNIAKILAFKLKADGDKNQVDFAKELEYLIKKGFVKGLITPVYFSCNDRPQTIYASKLPTFYRGLHRIIYIKGDQMKIQDLLTINNSNINNTLEKYNSIRSEVIDISSIYLNLKNIFDSLEERIKDTPSVYASFRLTNIPVTMSDDQFDLMLRLKECVRDVLDIFETPEDSNIVFDQFEKQKIILTCFEHLFEFREIYKNIDNVESKYSNIYTNPSYIQQDPQSLTSLPLYNENHIQRFNSNNFECDTIADAIENLKSNPVVNQPLIDFLTPYQEIIKKIDIIKECYEKYDNYKKIPVLLSGSIEDYIKKHDYETKSYGDYSQIYDSIRYLATPTDKNRQIDNMRLFDKFKEMVYVPLKHTFNSSDPLSLKGDGVISIPKYDLTYNRYYIFNGDISPYKSHPVSKPILIPTSSVSNIKIRGGAIPGISFDKDILKNNISHILDRPENAKNLIDDVFDGNIFKMLCSSPFFHEDDSSIHEDDSSSIHFFVYDEYFKLLKVFQSIVITIGQILSMSGYDKKIPIFNRDEYINIESILKGKYIQPVELVKRNNATKYFNEIHDSEIIIYRSYKIYLVYDKYLSYLERKKKIIKNIENPPVFMSGGFIDKTKSKRQSKRQKIQTIDNKTIKDNIEPQMLCNMKGGGGRYESFFESDFQYYIDFIEKLKDDISDLNKYRKFNDYEYVVYRLETYLSLLNDINGSEIYKSFVRNMYTYTVFSNKTIENIMRLLHNESYDKNEINIILLDPKLIEKYSKYFNEKNVTSTNLDTEYQKLIQFYIMSEYSEEIRDLYPRLQTEQNDTFKKCVLHILTYNLYHRNLKTKLSNDYDYIPDYLSEEDNLQIETKSRGIRGSKGSKGKKSNSKSGRKTLKHSSRFQLNTAINKRRKNFLNRKSRSSFEKYIQNGGNDNLNNLKDYNQTNETNQKESDQNSFDFNELGDEVFYSLDDILNDLEEYIPSMLDIYFLKKMSEAGDKECKNMLDSVMIVKTIFNSVGNFNKYYSDVKPSYDGYTDEALKEIDDMVKNYNLNKQNQSPQSIPVLTSVTPSQSPTTASQESQKQVRSPTNSPPTTTSQTPPTASQESQKPVRSPPKSSHSPITKSPSTRSNLSPSKLKYDFYSDVIVPILNRTLIDENDICFIIQYIEKLSEEIKNKNVNEREQFINQLKIKGLDKKTVDGFKNMLILNNLIYLLTDEEITLLNKIMSLDDSNKIIKSSSISPEKSIKFNAEKDNVYNKINDVNDKKYNECLSSLYYRYIYILNNTPISGGKYNKNKRNYKNDYKLLINNVMKMINKDK